MAVIDYTKLDAVTEDKLCRRAMEDERRAGQRWKENWGFLTNYNERVNSPNYILNLNTDNPSVMAKE